VAQRTTEGKRMTSIEPAIIIVLSVLILACAFPVYKRKALPTAILATIVILVLATDIMCIYGLMH